MKYKLAFSIVASFSGEHPMLEEWNPCDTSLSEVIKEWPGKPVEPSDPYDTEYQYLAREGSIPRRVLDRLDEVNLSTRIQICEKLKAQYGSEAFWACLSDVQMSGIFDRETTFGFLDRIGARFEDCETMGTLGGPLGGFVPDFSFSVESQILISSIRVTPVLCVETENGLEPIKAPSESKWERFKSLFQRFDCFDLARQGRAI